MLDTSGTGRSGAFENARLSSWRVCINQSIGVQANNVSVKNPEIITKQPHLPNEGPRNDASKKKKKNDVQIAIRTRRPEENFYGCPGCGLVTE